MINPSEPNRQTVWWKKSIRSVIRPIQRRWVREVDRHAFQKTIGEAWAYFRTHFNAESEVDMYGMLGAIPFRTGPTRLQILRERFLVAYPNRDEFLLRIIVKPGSLRELVYAMMMLENPTQAVPPAEFLDRLFIANDLHLSRVFVFETWFENWCEQFDDLSQSLNFLAA